MEDNPGAGGGAKAAQVGRRVALGDLTNVVAGGGRLGGPDAGLTEKEVHEAGKLKSCSTNVESLKEKLVEKQGHGERAEMELPKLEHSFVAVSEERDTMKDQSMLTKQETINVHDTLLKDMLSGLHGMDKIFISLDRTMDRLISRQHDERSFDERLSIERSKVQSLEQEIDQLRSQVALLQSKLGQGDYSASSTKAPCAVNTLAVDSEAKPKLNETVDWFRAVEEVNGQTGGAKKQPVVIEIYDDKDTGMWCNDDDKPSLKSNDPGNVEPGSELCELTGSHEWFFRGNKLMLSSEMKKHLRELCGSVPPQIPFYLYQMNKSNLKARGRMRLSAKYISKPLLSCLHKGVGYAHFEVEGEDRGTVTVKLNADGRASLTSGWESVVAAKDIKVGDICAFHFKISDGVLKLSVCVFHPVHHLVCVR